MKKQRLQKLTEELHECTQELEKLMLFEDSAIGIFNRARDAAIEKYENLIIKYEDNISAIYGGKNSDLKVSIYIYYGDSSDADGRLVAKFCKELLDKKIAWTEEYQIMSTCYIDFDKIIATENKENPISLKYKEIICNEFIMKLYGELTASMSCRPMAWTSDGNLVEIWKLL